MPKKIDPESGGTGEKKPRSYALANARKASKAALMDYLLDSEKVENVKNLAATTRALIAALEE